MPNFETAYCVRCKHTQNMLNAKKVTLKNGKHALQGQCEQCQTKMMKFVSDKK